ncbi:MAG: hypothetical protein CR972_01160 [Candidatus Moraniibacteriota bacterium]|nr:MAG: hypothetical protein CR972_01160 [Candidatus Moranbacteria bacterium]
MNKNQLVIALVIVVFVFACVFLYFVFRPYKNDNSVIVENEGQTYTFDVEMQNDTESDEIVAIVNEQRDDIVTIEELAKTQQEKNDNIQKKHEKEIVNHSAVNNSPETGPGVIAFIVALIAGGCGSIVAYKKMDKNM